MRYSNQHRVRIVTDTTAVLPPGFAAAHQVEVVPQVVLFGEESFQEDEQLSFEAFIQKLAASKELPKTAAPEPGRLIQAYARQLSAADVVLSIHPSTDVSGTVRSAITARESFPGADIRILDTRTVAGNLSTLVQLAAAWVEAGLGADEIMQRLEALIPRSRTYFLVDTLAYLQKGGRIGGAAALLGTVLRIKPILEFRNGRIEPLEKVRTHAQAVRHMLDLVLQHSPHTAEAYPCVMQAGVPDHAAQIAGLLREGLGVEHVPIYNMGASITTHAGPGVLGIGFFV